MKRPDKAGFSLIEVMFAMVILAFAIVGVMGMHQWAERALQHGTKGTRALALVESRLDAKRAAPWEQLLKDDLDADGGTDVVMKDDGEGADDLAGDGIYSASAEQGDIRLVWTVQPDRPGDLAQAGAALIMARASFLTEANRRHEIKVGTLRANPRYLGWR
jgi:prepilin-type N-terminal cleavage/methylation domain-containing protein